MRGTHLCQLFFKRLAGRILMMINIIPGFDINHFIKSAFIEYL